MVKHSIQSVRLCLIWNILLKLTFGAFRPRGQYTAHLKINKTRYHNGLCLVDWFLDLSGSGVRACSRSSCAGKTSCPRNNFEFLYFIFIIMRYHNQGISKLQKGIHVMPNFSSHLPTKYIQHCTMWNGVHINLDTIKNHLKSANYPNWLIFSGIINNMRMFQEFFKCHKIFVLEQNLFFLYKEKRALRRNA